MSIVVLLKTVIEQNKKHPWRRIAAFFIDCIFALSWAGILAITMLTLNQTGMIHIQQITNLAVANIVASLALVVPVTIWLALLESGRDQATLGKRLLHIKVKSTSGKSISLQRALVRNLLKVGLPWILGHAAVYEIIASDTDAQVSLGVISLTICAYILPIVYISSLFIRRGRTPYDTVLDIVVTQ